ncbi:activator of 90 kDa heat shock protein ATPase protein [Trifolium repens]|nr:activator of 90 kDa heat shock protein ATPase protein [Trifolium repens]
MVDKDQTEPTSTTGTGEAKDSDGNSLLKVNGSVEIPYISDENADEDPDLRVTVEDEGPIGKRIKDAMFSKGKGLILEKSMARGSPVKEELDVKKPVKQSNAPAAVKNDSVKKEIVVEKKEEEKKNENRWKGFTQSNAMISKERWRFGSWTDGDQSQVCGFASHFRDCVQVLLTELYWKCMFCRVWGGIFADAGDNMY